ncbi:glutamate-cysteine ligase family protein [Pseudonocardia thermophila]|uniref:glutamate-cysteine ligase family protein n=1 Tax=Pseudonocardia thermophila TaxID=1848 RepID=UPI0013563C2C|nr:glutamate-cysteine ligase family protein [Pseudonocardia thermophila]
MTAYAESVFTPCGRDLVGIELEWPLHRPPGVETRPAHADLASFDGLRLGAGSRVTIEPGGQVELSTAPFPTAAGALSAAQADSDALFALLHRADLVPCTLAVDDRRRPQRILDKSRYGAMEEFFAGQGWAGAWMMNNTTSTQINLSHDAADPVGRWDLLHRLAPVLIAAFSNSPGVDVHGRRWACLRQAIWWSIDPGRTRPVRVAADPARAWADYALDAPVMFITGPDDTRVVPAPGLTFRDWLTHGHPAGWPTVDDLRSHLTTLFPPVRPRGWLELRVLDALPEWIRSVAVLAVATAVRDDARRELLRRLPDTGGLWLPAIRDGLADPALAGQAEIFFEVVTAHLDPATVGPELAARVAEFRARYVARRRCPGDDRPVPFDLRAPLLRTAGAA